MRLVSDSDVVVLFGGSVILLEGKGREFYMYSFGQLLEDGLPRRLSLSAPVNLFGFVSSRL